MISLYLSLTVLEFSIDQAVLEQIQISCVFFIVFHAFYAFKTDVFKLVSSGHLLLVNRSKSVCLCLIFCNSANSLILTEFINFPQLIIFLYKGSSNLPFHYG